MRPYDQLTEPGKVRRLRGLARAALARYPLEVARIRCIARETNTTFRVDSRDGTTFALRVGARPEDTDVDTATELAWLDALASEAAVAAPRPQPNRAGDLVTVVEVDGVPSARKCVLFDWLPGRTIGEDATPADYRLLGELAARLHDHGERWRRPAGLRPLVWDRVFYYPDEPVVLYDAEYRRLMTPRRAAIVRTVEERANEELSRLHGAGPIMVLHGDLHPWNVHRHRGRLLVFDFEDVMLGTPIQDIAITLFYNRNRPDYPELRTAFAAGYSAVRPWPVGPDQKLRLLMAARTVMFINYVLRLGYDPDEYVPMAVRRIAPLASG